MESVIKSYYILNMVTSVTLYIWSLRSSSTSDSCWDLHYNTQLPGFPSESQTQGINESQNTEWKSQRLHLVVVFYTFYGEKIRRSGVSAH